MTENDESPVGRSGHGGKNTRVPPLTVAAIAIVLVVGVARRSQFPPADDGRVTRAANGTIATRSLGDSRIGAAPVTDTVTPATIALGQRIFQGKVAGALCTTCHGADAKGVTGLGPDLTDGKWLHGDGSMEFLENIISTGVAKPKEGAGIMPPFGGTPLEPEQLTAVAAYVYSLSHPAGG
jgi:Cytochrome c.